jgi:hypothetical protein
MAVSRLSQQSVQNAFPKGNTIWDGTTATSAFDSLGTGYVVTSGTTTTISFTSIPQTYTHLQIRLCAAENTAGVYFTATYNSDTAQTNYPRNRFYTSSSTSTASSSVINVDSTTSSAMLGTPLYSTTYPGVLIADIYDYTNTNKHKTTRSLFGQDANGSGILEMNSSVWLSTAAITRIDVRCNLSGGSIATSTFNVGSTVSLYGIK